MTPPLPTADELRQHLAYADDMLISYHTVLREFVERLAVLFAQDKEAQKRYATLHKTEGALRENHWSLCATGVVENNKLGVIRTTSGLLLEAERGVQESLRIIQQYDLTDSRIEPKDYLKIKELQTRAQNFSEALPDYLRTLPEAVESQWQQRFSKPSVLALPEGRGGGEDVAEHAPEDFFASKVRITADAFNKYLQAVDDLPQALQEVFDLSDCIEIDNAVGFCRTKAKMLEEYKTKERVQWTEHNYDNHLVGAQNLIQRVKSELRSFDFQGDSEQIFDKLAVIEKAAKAFNESVEKYIGRTDPPSSQAKA